MSLSEWSKEINRDLIEGESEQPRPGPFDELPEPTDFDRECAPMLRGCFLPAEPVTKVEEFTYRVRNCQPLPSDCDTLRGQVSQLQEQRPPLQESKNQACRDARPKDAECIYRYRQLEVVIDAIALTELAAERVCLQ